MKQFFLLLIPTVVSAGFISVHVRGQLLCHGKPWPGEYVALYEDRKFASDTLKNSTITDERGFFSMKANVYYFLKSFKPNVYFHVTNYCTPLDSVSQLKCGRTIEVGVPKYFHTDTDGPRNTFEMQEFELSTAETAKLPFPLMWFDQINCTETTGSKNARLS